MRQRIAVDMAGPTTKTQMIGQDVAMPVALAPPHADGEIRRRGPPRFGVPGHALDHVHLTEDVAAHTTKPFWFQVYTLKDDDFMRRLFERGVSFGGADMPFLMSLCRWPRS